MLRDWCSFLGTIFTLRNIQDKKIMEPLVDDRTSWGLLVLCMNVIEWIVLSRTMLEMLLFIVLSFVKTLDPASKKFY